MSRRIIITGLLVAVLATVAYANLRISIPSVSDSIMEVTCSFLAKGRERTAVFPKGGFDFAMGPIEVLDVHETNSGKELAWELTAAAQYEGPPQMVRVFYPYSLPRRGKWTTVTVRARSRAISEDSDNRVVVKYETSHATSFVVPTGFRLVYTNYPVTLREDNGVTIAEVKSTAKKNLLFKMRPFEAE